MKLCSCVLLSALFLFLGLGPASADDADLYTANVAPDALLVLDLSGSMRWTPAGETMYIGSSQTCGTDVAYYPTSGTGHTKSCTIDAYGTVPKYGTDASCTGLFYTSARTVSGVDYKTDCSRLAIAKRSIFDLLDDNNDGTVSTADETNLGIRMGYMRFYNCDSDDTGGNYSSGCNRLIREIKDLGTNNYHDIWSSVNSESASGGTPLASALNEGKLYLDYSKNGDPAKDCRNKFVILISDGSDTYACNGNGTEDQTDQYKRRRETVAKAKALSDAGYKVFVVGFGADMPHYLKNTLNWAAYYGKPVSGGVTGYDPSGVSSCQSSSTSHHNLGDGDHYYATSNDPGEASLSGYAFLATNAQELTEALKAIAKYIKEQAYYFTSPTVPSVQLVEGDTMYVSSFEPKNDNPFWPGNLKAYKLNPDGTLPVDAQPIWSASIPSSRAIKTYRRGGFVDFNSSNLTKEDLGVGTDAERDTLISYVRNLALGDIIHSNAVIVGEPSRFFEDECFDKCSDGSQSFYQRYKGRTKVIIVGANDGMLHAFHAGTFNEATGKYDDGTGVEKWAFIPNSLLKSLESMTSTHTYYVDSSPKVADVWLDFNEDNEKTTDEWRTVLVCGLRKGGKTYFALDITDTLSPQYLWEFPIDSGTLAKVGESWSEPAIGRVKIGGKETWVAFIGGGFDPNETRTTPASVGKAFFVIDIRTGAIIKEFSGLAGMSYSFAAPPAAVDINSDGFVDRVYIGDLGGQMWVFDVSNSDPNTWGGKILFQAQISSSEKHSIYYQPAVALDRSGKPWVYFGTGDRENPNDYTNQNERFYAVKDDGLGTYPRGESNLSDVTSSNTFTEPQDPLKGWFIELEKSANSLEKVLAKPVVFNQLVYFTTYTYTVSTDPCATGGSGKAYVVEYRSGGGAESTLFGDNLLPSTPSDRSVSISGSGSGVPSPPVISVNSEGKASITIMTTTGQILSQKTFSPSPSKAPLYWREVVQ